MITTAVFFTQIFPSQISGLLTRYSRSFIKFVAEVYTRASGADFRCIVFLQNYMYILRFFF